MASSATLFCTRQIRASWKWPSGPRKGGARSSATFHARLPTILRPHRDDNTIFTTMRMVQASCLASSSSSSSASHGRSGEGRGCCWRRVLVMVMLVALGGPRGAWGFVSPQGRLPPPRRQQQQSVGGSLRFWDGVEQAGEGSSSPPMVKDILALDFDGVVCDSATESGRAAFKSVRRLWPQVATFCSPGMEGSDKEMPTWLADAMRQLRPVVETGYENVLLARMCIEQYLQGSGSASAITIKDTMAKWHESLRALLLQKYGVTAQELVDLFGSVRDDWMAEDPSGWLAANRFYTGSDLSMGCPRFETYVITTKQTRFVEALLQDKGVDFPRDRIFGLGSGPKTDVLARLVKAQRDKASAEESVDREAVVHFVEDRIETLERVCADPRLQNVRLYFADWGYSTAEQRERALFNPRVTVIDLADFACMCRLMDPEMDSYPCFEPTCKDCRLSPERFSFIAPPSSSPPPSSPSSSSPSPSEEQDNNNSNNNAEEPS